MTNFEKIKQLSDEELKETLFNLCNFEMDDIYGQLERADVKLTATMDDREIFNMWLSLPAEKTEI